MENTGRYLIIVKIEDALRENAFFRILEEIDPHPLSVLKPSILAIKSELPPSEIFNALLKAVTINDTLIITMIGKYHAEQSSEFRHWLITGS